MVDTHVDGWYHPASAHLRRIVRITYANPPEQHRATYTVLSTIATRAGSGAGVVESHAGAEVECPP